MNRKSGIWFSLAVVVAVLAVAGFVYAAEHPAEHPTTGEQAEHPAEHPAPARESAMTKEDLAEAIERFVKDDAVLKGGYFLVYDKMAGKPLVLTLKKVHKDRLATIGHGVYFACADLYSPIAKNAIEHFQFGHITVGNNRVCHYLSPLI